MLGYMSFSFSKIVPVPIRVEGRKEINFLPVSMSAVGSDRHWEEVGGAIKGLILGNAPP